MLKRVLGIVPLVFGVLLLTFLPERVPATVILALCSLLVGIGLGLLLGIVAALRQGKWLDSLATLLSMALSAMAHFWLGPLLMLLLALWLGLLPVSGMSEERAGPIVLPALTLGFGLAAILTRMTRASLLDVLNEDFIRTARANGISERKEILRDPLRAVLLPIVTVVSLQLSSLLEVR